MYLIGITGAIGSGKSTLLKHLKDYGYPILDADAIAHEILEADDDVWAALVTHFGDDIIDHEGKICRSSLAHIVFRDPEELAFLESNVHPKIINAILAKIEHMTESQRSNLVFIEAALLFRANLDQYMDEIWVLMTERKTLRDRLIQTRHLSEEETDARLAAIDEIPEDKQEICKYIDNSGAFEYTAEQVAKLLLIAFDAKERKEKANS